MRRLSVVAVFVVLAGLSTSAQIFPRYSQPKADPNAFKISTQANLEEALTRIGRLKSQLAQTKEADEREFLINRILELCQEQLNEDNNDSGVIIVERTDMIFPQPDADESVYDVPIRWQGAFSAVEEELRSLGEEGLTQYEKVYGARASLLLKQAVETRQRERMQYLNRRFGLTKAGVRAGALLANMWFEEGEVSKSARCLERVLSIPELLTVDQRAMYSVWLGHCYRDLGERANLLKLIEQTVTIRDRKVDVGGEQLAVGAVLQQRLMEARDATTDTVDALGVEWPGGNYTNTGLHEKPSDYRQIAWTKTLPRLGATPNYSRFMNYRSSIVPPFLPLFDGNSFYVNTGDRLVAYDLAGSKGDDPTWSCIPFPAFSNNWRTTEPDPGLIMPVSAYRGTLFAAIENPLSTVYHDPNPDQNYRLYSHYPKVRRALCAVDSSTGRLMWKLGGQYEGLKEDQTNFLSSVVYEGTLYAIASRVPSMAEIFLYAINPDTGDVLWNLRLCYGQQETTMFGRPAREPHPSLPCITGGTLYLCTNIGGVVSVDLATRSLRWISRYEYIPRPITKYTETFYREVTWYNSPTIYTESKGKPYVIVAPTDADKMFALDARSGKVVWDIAQDSQPLYGGRALVGVRDGKVIVAGDGGSRGGGASRLHIIDIDNPRAIESIKVTPVDRGNLLSLAGRPCMSDNSVIWPGQEWSDNGCTLAQIDLDKKKVVNSAYVSGTYAGWGYSVFTQHGVVYTVSGNDYSRGNNQLAARFNAQALLDAARAEYKENPDDADCAVRYGLLSLRMGDRTEAMTALKRAFELASRAPLDPRIRDQAGRALVGGYLELADKALEARKYTEALGFVQNAREYAVGRAQLSDCFVREERALLAEGRGADIEEFYRGIIKLDPDFGVGDNPEIPVGLYSSIRLAERLEVTKRDAEAVELWQDVQGNPDRYTFAGEAPRALALGRIRAAIRRSGRSVYSTQDAAADNLIDEKSPDAWRKVLRLYPLSMAADTAALELAESRRANWAPNEGAEILRTALEENPERKRGPELQALLALCYKDAGERLRARLLALRVLRESPNGELNVNGRTTPFRDFLKQMTEGAADEASTQALPQMPKQVAQLWARPWEMGAFTRLPGQPVSMPSARFHVGETGMNGPQLVALDAATGKPAWTRQLNVSVTGIHRTSRGVLFVQGNGFSLFDDEGNEQWSTPSGGTPDPVSLQGGMLVYATRFLNTRTRKNMVRITARDVDSGGLVWPEPNVDCELEGNSVRWIGQCPTGIVVMAQGNETTLSLLNAENGEVIATRVLDSQGRITVHPILLDDRLLIIDRDGKVQRLDIDTLRPAGEFETKLRYPTMFEAVDGQCLIVGLTSVGRFDVNDGHAIWRRDYGDNEMMTAQVMLKDSIAIATRSPSAAGHVTAYALKDGKPKFTYDVPRTNQTDRVDLQNAAGFDGGVVVVFADNRIIDGRMQLWGFRMLVLETDGTERFVWEHHAEDSPLFIQLALTDNYIALTCDKTTFGFGRKE
ncbi:MAG: PQQ-binding-like beta-propeller repeat protein [Planctomycetes bacterium]|nr:PQQ-binding-like beta-propeller repeat protein [Planctomycetota bacterium]